MNENRKNSSRMWKRYKMLFGFDNHFKFNRRIQVGLTADLTSWVCYSEVYLPSPSVFVAGPAGKDRIIYLSKMNGLNSWSTRQKACTCEDCDISLCECQHGNLVWFLAITIRSNNIGKSIVYRQYCNQQHWYYNKFCPCTGHGSTAVKKMNWSVIGNCSFNLKEYRTNKLEIC